jgi:hypothetical protein
VADVHADESEDVPARDAASTGGGGPGEAADHTADETPAEAGHDPSDRRLFRAALALTLLPLAVSALALFVSVRPGFLPTADHALIEMQVRDVGHRELLHGLYSREDWSHPGPMFAYLAAPVYRLLGSTPVAVNTVALLLNGGAIAGMALIAHRLGGRGPMLATLVGCALLLRTLGAEIVRDPWNNYVTVLPFGLMIFLTWAMLCREAWALPAGVVVASFLAQAHAGFVLLALPLLLLGAGALVVAAGRAGPGPDRRRLVRPALLALGLLALLWLPPVYDAAVNGRDSNLAHLVRYFRDSKEATHSLVEGWGVVTGQFAWPPEWATNALGQNIAGEDRHMSTRPLPVLLALVALAALVVWRRPAGRRLVAVLVVALGLGIVAVARTLGGAFYYRLFWAWIPPVVAFVVVGWAGWMLVERRWPERGTRVLTAGAVAVLAVLAVVNSVTQVTTDTRAEADGDAVAALLPPLLDDLAGTDGTVIIADALNTGAWYSRGIVLELERRGIDVKVPAGELGPYSPHRVYRGGPLAGAYLVTRDQYIEHLARDPSLRLVAEWSSVSPGDRERAARATAGLDADLEDGRIDAETYYEESRKDSLYDRDLATYYAVAVFRMTNPGIAPYEP